MHSADILITGITGFIGQHLANALQAHGAKVLGITGRQDKRLPGIANIDLRDQVRLKEYVQEVHPSIIFHLGAYVALDRNYETARSCIDTNIQGTLNLLDAVSNMKTPVKRVVFLSTEEVYGRSPLPYREDQPVFPPSPYAISKIAGEHFLALYRAACGLPTIVLRLATVYGPLQPLNRFIPRTIKAALLHEDIAMNSGTSARDYVYVEDAISALIEAGFRAGIDGEVINIGNDQSISGKELVEAIVRLTGTNAPIRYGAIPERVGEATTWQSDTSKARRLLGWHPTVSLEAGLKKTIDHYRTTLLA